MKGEVIMKVNPRRILVLALVTLSLFAASVGPIAAHHSTVPFDSTKQTTITGIVKEFDWTNPHTWIWINVPNDKGGVDLWGVEGMSPNYLGRRGWTKNTIKPGEKITVVGRPMKDGSKAAMFMSATLANGKVMTQSGQPTD
jgi:Family of unknown function (DUF6152)